MSDGLVVMKYYDNNKGYVRSGWHRPELFQQWLHATMHGGTMVMKYYNQKKGWEVVGIDKN
jgi:hypothetical protein